MQNDPPAAAKLDAMANAHLLRGLERLNTATPDRLREAVACFDAAIELRRQLPLAANPWFRYGLIAGWLNRGDALTRLGRLAEALAAFDEGLRHLRELPRHDNPLFVRRLAIAWLNRGLALLAHGTPKTAAQAADNFREAIAAAEQFARREPDEGFALLAGAWMNLANAFVRCEPPAALRAREAAQKALALTAARKEADKTAAEITFKALHILCQSLAGLLSAADTTAGARDAWRQEATDAVESGMALTRRWHTHGEKGFDAAATELFRFGCRAYQIYQPHFLTEFLLENLEAEGFRTGLQMHDSAAETLWHALAALHQHCFKTFNTAEFEPALERFRELRVTGERLAGLRRRFAENPLPAG